MIVRRLGRPVDLLDLHALDRERYPHLLESVAFDRQHNRYDILFRVSEPAEALGEDALTTLDAIVAGAKGSREQSIPLPFHGGWFVYLGYELAGQIEPSLRLPSFDALPVALVQRSPAAFVVDRADDELYIVAEPGARALADGMQRDVEALEAESVAARAILASPIDEQDPARFLAAVRRAREYIAAGDIFQANLSRLWEARLHRDVTPRDVYRRLRRANPAPFAALATFGSKAIVSSSPERLLSVRDGVAETRPIAGTRPRGATDESDRALRDELSSHPKENAEHVMLIDLERNDLGRIAADGTVGVTEFMTLESYAHVHHIVSNIRAVIRPDVSAGDAIAALFPGGTITGCPKVRCMQIIAELEGEARGPYTGSLGYLNRDGSMDLNILIRTLFVDGERVTLRAGGGIVADSVADAELAETRAKARGLLLALDSQPE